MCACVYICVCAYMCVYLCIYLYMCICIMYTSHQPVHLQGLAVLRHI
jgi:hypothetical protein